jgi:hypothetical protein
MYYVLCFDSSECVCREVDCPLGCGKQGLLFNEVSDHIHHDCDCQPVACDLCGIEVPNTRKRVHMEEQCMNRLVDCTQGCGEVVKAILMPRHLPQCTQRDIRVSDSTSNRLSYIHIHHKLH